MNSNESGVNGDSDQPWGRKGDESPEAYAAFVNYLEAGRRRSAAKVARELGKTPSLWHRWSAAHEWLARASAFDAWTMEGYAQAMLEARRTLAYRHADLAQTMLEKVAKRVETIDPEQLTVTELIRLAEFATRTEAAAYELPKPPTDEDIEQQKQWKQVNDASVRELMQAFAS